MREVGAIGAAMTGSGATVFGVFGSDADRSRALEELKSVDTKAAEGRWIQSADFLRS